MSIFYLVFHKVVINLLSKTRFVYAYDQDSHPGSSLSRAMPSPTPEP